MFFYNWSPATWKTQKLASHMVPHGPIGLSLLEISQLRHGSVHLFDVDLWDHLGLGQSWEQNWIKLDQRCEASWIIYDACLFGVAESTGISHDWTHPLASCKAPEKALKNTSKSTVKTPIVLNHSKMWRDFKQNHQFQTLPQWLPQPKLSHLCGCACLP